MTVANIQRLPLRSVGTDLCEAGLDWWRGNGGLIDLGDEKLQQVGAEIQISLDDPGAWTPPFLYIGPRSTTARVYGTDFASSAAGRYGLPDQDLERAVNAGYREVSDVRKPVYDSVYAKVHMPQNRLAKMQYDRLIFPARLKSSQRVFAVFTTITRIVQSAA